METIILIIGLLLGGYMSLLFIGAMWELALCKDITMEIYIISLIAIPIGVIGGYMFFTCLLNLIKL